MVSKTREKSHHSKKGKHKRGVHTQTKKNQRTAPTAPAQRIESHRYVSSMTFDGNTLTTKTQKDNEPVIERRYTKEQLAREIPIGKEMVDMYLDGKMPKGLQEHHRNKTQGIGKMSPVFQNVLVSPADLGLLPPRSTYDEELDDFLRRGHRHQTKKLRMKRQEKKRSRDRDDAVEDGLDLFINENNKKKHIFDLP